jgi:hypothetical protein
MVYFIPLILRGIKIGKKSPSLRGTFLATNFNKFEVKIQKFAQSTKMLDP